MLQEINVLNVEVIRAANSTNLWHDQEVAWGNRMRVLEGDDCIILVHDVGWFFLPNDACEDILLGRFWQTSMAETRQSRLLQSLLRGGTAIHV